MVRGLPLLCAAVLLLALEPASMAGAQSNYPDTRGSTRRVGSEGHHRRSRRRSRNDEDGDRGRRRNGGRSGWANGLDVGIALDVMGGIFNSELNGLSGPRTSAQDVHAGILPSFGAGARAWLGIERLRLGMAAGGGALGRLEAARFPTDGAFEGGSELGVASYWDLHLVGAYAPQLSEAVSLWLGGRVGMHVVSAALEWNGRHYGDVDRVAFSIGPEVILHLADGPFGIQLAAFADLGQPGLVRLTASLVIESGRVDGPAF